LFLESFSISINFNVVLFVHLTLDSVLLYLMNPQILREQSFFIEKVTIPTIIIFVGEFCKVNLSSSGGVIYIFYPH
jgi:hypothetical protein